MRSVLWTHQARSDLAAIRTFISQDSLHYASVAVAQLIAATDRLSTFPESGRAVPAFDNPLVREVVHRPYRIVYRLVGVDQIHVLTVHHGSQRFRNSNWAAQHRLGPVALTVHANLSPRRAAQAWR